jgi:uncharacterized protein (TIGR02246 family)
MSNDEQAIRDLQTKWFEATASGNLSQLLPLMAEDVVFLTPGGPPFGRDVFAASFEAGLQKMRIQCSGELEEVIVAGDMAYSRGRLSISLVSLAGGELKRLAGYTLSVYRRQPDGRWVLARDANLLAPESKKA